MASQALRKHRPLRGNAATGGAHMAPTSQKTRDKPSPDDYIDAMTFASAPSFYWYFGFRRLPAEVGVRSI